MATDVKEGNLVVGRSATRAETVIEEVATPAPFSLRCGALIIDYMICAGVVAFSTVIASASGDGTRAVSSGTQLFGVVVALILLFANFGIIAGFTGQTIGKWVTGLQIERTDAAEVGFVRVLIRHFIGYPLSFLTLGFGFLLAVLNSRGRALHDIIAGTVVVQKHGSAGRR